MQVNKSQRILHAEMKKSPVKILLDISSHLIPWMAHQLLIQISQSEASFQSGDTIRISLLGPALENK